GQKLAWLHYGSGHVSAIRFGQQLVTEFTRDRLHREVRRTQGAREQFRQYDSLGRRTLQCSELSADVTLPEQALLERLYRYTARGELSGVSDTLRGEVDYGYDAEGRLLKHYEARQGHSREQFSYDAADNLAASDAAVPVTDNRLQHWQALFMKYDSWGNLVSRRIGLYEQHYAYDAENRLVSARGTGPEGRFEARYHYDALGRRTRKIVTTTHGTTDTRFLWQGYRLLQEQQQTGLCSTYIYDPNEAWSPLARVDHLRDQSSGEIYWFNTDLNGAPLEVTDERGAVRWSGQYGSFGEVRHQSEGFSRVVNRTAMAHQPLRYAGQYADGETGLHYNLFRYYDPQVGRFIVQDPIGLNGGWNLYQYAPNPLGWIDPWGLSGTDLVTYWPPNDGAYGETKITLLKPGTQIDRYGYPGGTYTSPVGTPYPMRALPPGTDAKPYTIYEVMKPIPNVQESKIAPWFGEMGMGTQYKLQQSVQSYIDSGHLKVIKQTEGKTCG
ncbi:TPA: glycohydrolase toxin TNT-related protein, partial [Enterobacter hormaechei]